MLSVAIMELLLFLVVCWMIMRRSHRECSGDMEKREDDDVLLEIFFRKQDATPIWQGSKFLWRSWARNLRERRYSRNHQVLLIILTTFW